MYLVAEAERRIDRGRQIVAQQRELVAKVGAALPAAVALLKAFETTLALLENTLANYQRYKLITAGTQLGLRNSEMLSGPISEVANSPAWDHEGQMRDVARVLQILRAVGCDCKLTLDTLH